VASPFEGLLIAFVVFYLPFNDHVDKIFIRAWRDPRTVVLELLSIAIIIAFTRIDWPRVLHIPMPGGIEAAAT